MQPIFRSCRYCPPAFSTSRQLINSSFQRIFLTFFNYYRKNRGNILETLSKWKSVGNFSAFHCLTGSYGCFFKIQSIYLGKISYEIKIHGLTNLRGVKNSYCPYYAYIAIISVRESLFLSTHDFFCII